MQIDFSRIQFHVKHNYLLPLTVKSIKQKIILMRLIAFITLLTLTNTAFAQDSLDQNDYLLVVWDTVYYNCGYVDGSGEYVIPKGKYSVCLTDTFRNFAVVYKSNRGFVGINRDEELLFQIFQYDNGPDYPSEGLFRITKDNKLGFANLDGKIIVEEKYDAAYPFSEGLAAFCKGCTTQKMGEYSMWKNGKWGFIDKTGKEVIAPQFDKVNNGFTDGKIKVKVGEEIFEINNKGERIE